MVKKLGANKRYLYRGLISLASDSSVKRYLFLVQVDL